MGVLYIAGQRPGVGSTALAASLATRWQRAGRKVAVLKPLALEDGTADSELFASITGTREAAPLSVGATVTGDVVDSAARRVESAAKSADVVIVEGLPMTDASGAPIEASPVLAKKLNAKVIGVAPYRRDMGRGDAESWRGAYGDALAGMVVNRRTRYAGHDASSRLVPELAEAGVRPIGVLGEDRRLLAPTVRQVADLLNGRFVTAESNADRLIEHLLIGALITEWGGNYFGRYENQAVIARCGRTDLQMAALAFPLNALFLSGGCQEPPQYVYQRAEYMDVPVIMLRQTTQQAVDALSDLRVTVHHPEKIARMAELAERALDWDALAAAAGLS